MKQKKHYVSSIGKVFPFYIGNPTQKNYYLYQVVSPKLNEKCKPLITLRKISERTGEKDFSASFTSMNHGDILATLLKTRKKLETKGVKYLEKEILARYSEEDRSDNTINLYEDGSNFPMFNLDYNILKTIIVGLRDSLRWSKYKLQPGTEVDILLTPTKFGIFEIQGDRESMKLAFKAAYDNMDVERKFPLDLKEDEIQYPKDEFKGEKRASDLNKAIRSQEMKAFETED